MALETNESMIRYLVLEVVEAAINMALSHDSAALDRLREYEGRVVRIKTTAPDWMFFVVLCGDGVQLFLEHEEVVDARLTLPTSLLAQFVLGSDAGGIHGAEGVRVSGDLQLLAELVDILQAFSIWSLFRRILNNWLPEFDGLNGLIEALKNHDPAWIVRLEHLPQMANETLAAVRAQQEVQEQMLAEIAVIRRQLDADRRANRISTVIGFCLIIVAFLAHNGFFEVPQIRYLSFDTLILLILSLVLLIPRLLGGR